jgi:putative FmdB family regulatory protein
MPTYDYKCKECQDTFVVLQGINEPHLTECKICKKPTLKRLIGCGGMVRFKGTGFYETDYKHK